MYSCESIYHSNSRQHRNDDQGPYMINDLCFYFVYTSSAKSKCLQSPDIYYGDTIIYIKELYQIVRKYVPRMVIVRKINTTHQDLSNQH